MDIGTAFTTINWLSIIAAGVSAFLIGGVWYGPLFGRTWMKEFGFTEEDLKQRNVPKTFGLSLVLALFAAINLDMFIGAEASLSFGAMAGLLAGIGWVATFMGIIYLFEMRSLAAFLINAGYCVIALTTMGAILGAW